MEKIRMLVYANKDVSDVNYLRHQLTHIAVASTYYATDTQQIQFVDQHWLQLNNESCYVSGHASTRILQKESIDYIKTSS